MRRIALRSPCSPDGASAQANRELSVNLAATAAHRLDHPCMAQSIGAIVFLDLVGVCDAAPQLSISPRGYWIAPVQPFPAAGALRRDRACWCRQYRDPAVDVTARLTSTMQRRRARRDVRFGAVPLTPHHRNQSDTFSLRSRCRA